MSIFTVSPSLINKGTLLANIEGNILGNLVQQVGSSITDKMNHLIFTTSALAAISSYQYDQKVKKVVSLLSTCVYPDSAKYPLTSLELLSKQLFSLETSSVLVTQSGES